MGDTSGKTGDRPLVSMGDQLLATPEPRIQMEKIFIDVDTNGGNSLDGGFVWELLYGFGDEILHNKAPHRIPICNKVIEYLED